MSVKEKLTKEINRMPDVAAEQLYRYLQFFKKGRVRKPIKNNSEDEQWQRWSMQEFLNGYAKSDAMYDKL